MSRREGRDSDSRRHRSRFDREPSPKRSRREGKPETERVVSNADVAHREEQDEKQRSRLKDALPLEAPTAPGSSKIESGALNKGSDRGNNGHHEGNKHSSDPTQVPRSRSYFQHDERGNAAQAGRDFGRRAATERGWWRNAKDQHSEREAETYDTRQRDDKVQFKGNNNGDWRHDKFFEMEANPPPPTKKRPAFSEKKIHVETPTTDSTTNKDPVKASHSGHHALGSERRVERDQNLRELDRQDRFAFWNQHPNRREVRRRGSSFYERFGHTDGNKRRQGFSSRQGYRSGGSGTPGDKWTHDLFEESNTSPPRKNEDDQIAKVESLLSS